MNHRCLSLALALVFLSGSIAAANPSIDYSKLDLMPVQDGGRKKPYSTFARETLLALSGKSTFVPEHVASGAGTRWDPGAVVTDIWLSPDGWKQEKLILVNLKPLKSELRLPEDQKRFAASEIAKNPEFRRQMAEVQRLRSQNPNAKLDRKQNEIARIGSRLDQLDRLMSGDAFRVVPNPAGREAEWASPGAVRRLHPESVAAKVASAFGTLSEAYASDDPARFDSSASAFVESLRALAPELQPGERILALEGFYYSSHPFRIAWILYAIAGIVLATTSVCGRGAGYRIGWALVGLGFASQAFGFACRIAISGRPPVTNMYESVIWVAFGCISFALIFEAIYRCRYFLLGATPVAVVSLILADSQPTILSSGISPLVPVLRDNFWLTTHVLSITLSYAAFALALGVAHIMLGKAIAGVRPSENLHTYLYRTLQIGVLLLGTGTILGAVWANYSWGRFWDWDPKETWALIAFLSYLILLHGRIAGIWGGFGLAIGSVIAFQSVLMAWYGVNFVLGAGLHSYGFGTGGFPVVLGLVLAEFAFVVVAIVRAKRVEGTSQLPARASELARADEAAEPVA